MWIAFNLLIMPELRNHKPKQVLNSKGSRHRILSCVMHDPLRRYRTVQIGL